MAMGILTLSERAYLQAVCRATMLHCPKPGLLLACLPYRKANKPTIKYRLRGVFSHVSTSNYQLASESTH
jgi:hypothetical protein